MLTYKLYFIRHGMTEGNRDGRYVGWTDLDLCEEGINQIKSLEKEYDYPDVQEVYCSPLTRCKTTADLIYPNHPMTVVDGLMELSLGAFEGKTFVELEKLPEYKAWLSDSINNAPPDSKETGKEFASRIAGAVNAIFMDMNQRRITKAAVITHGGVIMGLMSAFALPRMSMGHWAVSGGSGFVVSMSTQMWMRDNSFEIIGTVPEGYKAGEDLSVMRSLGVEED